MLAADFNEILTHIENTIRKELTETITKAVNQEIEKRNLQMIPANKVKDLLNVAKGTVYELIHSGLLPATKIGKEWQIRPQDLAEFEENAAGYDLTDEQSRIALKKALIARGKTIRAFK